jgi:hypothetical protein
MTKPRTAAIAVEGAPGPSGQRETSRTIGE